MRSRPTTLAVEICEAGRRCDDAHACRPLLAQAHARRSRESRREDRGCAEALDTIFPWLAHDAMIHLTVPHGLEQYTGGAWGTRDVCQGPIEFLLTLEHDDAAKEILRILFAQQYEKSGDWPQWFMLEPYSVVQDRESHGDIIVWPLKALCDYIEATGDLAFLDEPIAWRREDDFKKTAHADTITAHVDKLIETVERVSFRARISFATATATGTIRFSRSIRRSATGWSAAGRSRCSTSSFAAMPRSCAGRSARQTSQGV